MLSIFEQMPDLPGKNNNNKNNPLTADLLANYTHILCLLQGTTRITS